AVLDRTAGEAGVAAGDPALLEPGVRLRPGQAGRAEPADLRRQLGLDPLGLVGQYEGEAAPGGRVGSGVVPGGRRPGLLRRPSQAPADLVGEALQEGGGERTAVLVGALHREA